MLRLICADQRSPALIGLAVDAVAGCTAAHVVDALAGFNIGWRHDHPGGGAVGDGIRRHPAQIALFGQFFERDPSDRRAWRVCEAARSLVAFRELNLNGPSWPMKGPFDAIFCRNVVIYFDEPTQERVWSRFAPLLAPGGKLYVGHSERVGANVRGFESCGLTAYRKAGV